MKTCSLRSKVAINIKVTIVRQTIKLNPLYCHVILFWQRHRKRGCIVEMIAVKNDANYFGCKSVICIFVIIIAELQPQLKNGTHSSCCFYNRFISNGIPLPSIYSQHFTYSLYPLVQNYKLIITHVCLPPDSCFPISYPFLHQTLFRKESLQQL